jgi:hypothetical protein
LIRRIQKYVEYHKARYKWINGGVEFIDVIPRSPSGKILRSILEDREKEGRREDGSEDIAGRKRPSYRLNLIVESASFKSGRSSESELGRSTTWSIGL